MYDEIVPPLTLMLGALKKLIDKAEAHCAARKIDPEAFLRMRLFPDMFPFTKQVQLASDFAKGTAARLSGVANPPMPDTEASFAELRERLQKTLDFLASVPREAFDGAAAREIVFRTRGQDVTAPGRVYAGTIGLPQFYFHMTTAYNLLRHGGVEIGKADFLGRS